MSALLRTACRRPHFSSPLLARRTLVTVKEIKYVAHATATGAGRNGTVKSLGDPEDAALDLKLSSPKSMGGDGKGQNPEQLFAMGYASCFLGALQLVAGQQGKKQAVSQAKIHSEISLGTASDRPGFAVSVNIKVEGVQDMDLIKAAHEFCPYSRALTQGAQVNVTKA